MPSSPRKNVVRENPWTAAPGAASSSLTGRVAAPLHRRTIAADPAVLLLDEITASLDAEAEERVLSALRRATKGHTVLSISHRVYEKRGRVVEIG